MKQIPPIKLICEPVTDEARDAMGFRWAAPEIGKRHQLGGAPKFIQDREWPNCTHCRQPMSFYAQLDSIGEKFTIADCGMVYVFVCFDCNEASALIQSY